MILEDDAKTIEDSHSKKDSPGKMLLRGRERAELTQEQVAKELYMTLTRVRALEGDDYRHMTSDTFTRGYLRAYANLLKLDIVQVLAAYDRQTQRIDGIEQPLPRQVESSTKNAWQFVGLIVAALVVLWLISIWFFDNRQEPEYELPATIAQLDDTQTVVIGNKAENSSAAVTLQQEPAAVDQTGLPASVSIASSVASAAVDSHAVALSNATPLDEISFSFSEECWLEVSDSRGDVLATELQRAGSRLALKGKAPFSIKLGNSPAVELLLNGKKVAIVPALDTNVLELKVGE